MPWAVAAAVVGAGASIYAGNKAASAQEKASNQATDISQRQYEQTRADLAPYRDAGAGALQKYADAAGINGADRRTASFADFRADPGYEFQMSEGLRGVQGSAAAGSLGINGGGVLKALQRYGQGVADQGYNTYLGRLQNLSTMGQNSAAQTGTFGANAAAQQGGYAQDAGAARAGGYLSAAQGVNGAISNGLKFYGYQNGYGSGSGYGSQQSAPSRAYDVLFGRP
jgi:hypothetical protein